tara:strand:- start:347 stop:919 length:573 start_codon:yes stop_codon:yes gene_type:complete
MSILDALNNIGEDLMLFKNNFTEIFTNPRMRNIIIFLFILFFSISIYIYFKFIHPNLNLTYVDNSEFVSPKEDKMVVLWFYTEWCPYCKSTYYDWKSFKSDVENGNFDIPIEFREIDCDKDETLANKYNIQEYPSIRIVYKDELYIYDAKPDRIQLMEFLKGSLPPSPINLEEISSDVKEVTKEAILGHN